MTWSARRWRVFLPIFSTLITLPFVAGCSKSSQVKYPRLEQVPTFHVQYFLQGDRLVTIPEGSDKVPTLWNLDTGKVLMRFIGHRECVRAVALSPDQRYVITGGGEDGYIPSLDTDYSVRLWDSSTGKEVKRLDGHSRNVHTVAFFPDGKRALAAFADQTVVVWDLETGGVLHSFLVWLSTPPAVILSLDGTKIAAKVGNHRITVWDASTGEPICHFERSDEFLEESIQFSPCGRWLVSASDTGTVHQWDTTTRTLHALLHGHTDFVHKILISADGKWIVTASHDRTVRIWESESGREIKRLVHRGPVADILISSDSRLLISQWSNHPDNSSRDNTSLWDIPRGLEIKQIANDSTSTVGIVGFTPDGKKILVVAKGRPAALLDAGTGDVIRKY
jgi:WD40 repeat protein